MKAEVLMPKLGEGITEGTIVKWWKNPGEYVKKDETLLEISTDKVDSEIPSPYEGVVVEIKAQPNDTVPVDTVIAIIDTEAVEGTAPEQPAPPEAEPVATPAAAPVQSPPESKPASPSSSSGGGPGAGIVDVEMPRLGESITEGTIVKWWKKPGDHVNKDETLLEISTDKVDSEIPSPYEGTVAEILVNENETVSVGTVICRIQTGNGAVTAPSAVEAPASVTSEPVSASAPPAAAPVVTPTAEPIPRQAGGRFYSPLVRSIARKEGISREELAAIPGTGLQGRVTKKDILQYLETRKKAPTAAPTVPPTPASAPSPAAQPAPAPEEVAAKWQGQPVEIIPMDAIRKKIADHMVQSKHTSAHVYGVAECDFTNVINLVNKHKADFQQREGFKLTINPFILFSVAKAIKDFPDINCSVEGYTVIRKKFVNIGMAVATERGLIVPTLKNAEQLNFTGIARNAYDLAIRARDRKLKLEDVQGATFTVTNYGVFGNIIGFPIINQPNVAIMGVGAVKKRPVVIESEQGDVIGIRSIGFLTLSYDHRIVDGELGDKFLQRVRHYLETFEDAWM